MIDHQTAEMLRIVIPVACFSFVIGSMLTMMMAMPCLMELARYQALEAKQKKLSELNQMENEK